MSEEVKIYEFNLSGDGVQLSHDRIEVAASSVEEAREKVLSAIENSGVDSAQVRVTPRLRLVRPPHNTGEGPSPYGYNRGDGIIEGGERE